MTETRFERYTRIATLVGIFCGVPAVIVGLVTKNYEVIGLSLAAVLCGSIWYRDIRSRRPKGNN